MKSVPLSTRVSEEEARAVDELARRRGLDRSALLKQVIRRGLADLRVEEACEAYRKRRVSLSRAAEIAGLGVRDMLLRLGPAQVEVNYDATDLLLDLAAEL